MAGIRRLRTAVTIARLLPVYLAFGMLKRRVAFGTLARWAWRAPAAARNEADERRLVACVVQLERLTRQRDRSCVQRSLLLYRELSRLGSDPTLRVGFQPGPAALKGHAWVDVDGRALLEDARSLAGFAETHSYARHGALVPPQRTFSMTSAASSSSSMN